MTDSTNPFLVLGATGKTGRRVAARLRMLGLPVRAASRTSPAPFDWADPGGWDAVLQGVTAAYVVPPPVQGPAPEFVAKAEAAGVRQLVLLSGRGADDWGDSPFGREMREAEDAVRGSSIPWTVLRPNNFAQNFDEELWHAPLLHGELALPAGDVPEPFVDLEDVAEVAVRVLTDPDRHAGLTHDLTGPRSIAFGEAVELISRATGRPISYRQISTAEYVDALVEQGVDRHVAHDVAEMFTLMDSGLIAKTAEGVADVLGRPPRPFEDYVARVAAAGVWNR
ncbi:NAD(P)H-binding protein [Mycobacterium sp. ITM-2016-00317]|uniref:NAD(P)H-binding protein n=1 Tax=Mycobacterium sp. ITM-2016-00317 TaxID=2099694 RepID=UPI000D47DC12|nr:NAD(P)H-binding protein [Mycobacterium sp. ITM-2016-00317]WNG88576.1 NAD(P)H-binding protein [Mycobacterium sp. ITM-2016-00317]